MNQSILIRKANSEDLFEILELFSGSVKSCTADYTREQIEVWLLSAEKSERWLRSIESQYFILATLHEQIVGFASLKKHDYLDFLYVHQNFQRKGIAQLLYSEIEKKAQFYNSAKIISNVSITAKPFFEQQGFKVEHKNINLLNGVEIINFKMIKMMI